jgi:hypothetical protein
VLAGARRLAGDVVEARQWAEQAVALSQNRHGTTTKDAALTEYAKLVTDDA